MELGFVGLGRMGANMVTRLVNGGHTVVAHDRDAAAVRKAEAGGAQQFGGRAVRGAAPGAQK